METIPDRSELTDEESPVEDRPAGEIPAEQALVSADDRRLGILAKGGVGMIRFYQRAISPLTPPACRFRPTCSQYTLTAIKRHGFLKGSWLGLRRVMRCHPFHPGGHDPVP